MYIWNPPIRERGQEGVFSAKDPPEKARKKRREEDMDNMRRGVGKRGGGVSPPKQEPNCNSA